MMKPDTLLKGKTVLVTGATSGIGKAAALGLASMGARLVVAGRCEDRCRNTVAEITDLSGNPSVSYLTADLSVLSGMRKLARDFLKRHKRLHVLINNAGGFYYNRQETGDGFEKTFALNHLAYFMVTSLLLPTIKKSAPARIINISSGIHFREKRMPFDDLQTGKGYAGFKAYGRSKLANVLFTYELARRLEGSGITVNVYDPGLTATNLGMQGRGLMPAMKRMVDKLWGKSPEQAARMLLHLASSSEVESLTGKYFRKTEQVASSVVSYDRETQARLWAASEDLTGLKTRRGV